MTAWCDEDNEIQYWYEESLHTDSDFSDEEDDIDDAGYEADDDTCVIAPVPQESHFDKTLRLLQRIIDRRREERIRASQRLDSA